MAAIFNNIIYKIVSFFLSIAMLFGYSGDGLKEDSSEWNTNYKYVFVHGLSGWGSYDEANKVMPYWGMFGGDLMEYLNDKGFDCYAASVSPSSSAWDRACELYAQLTGTVVDYGKAHSERCGHERYGTDFTGRALIDSFSSEDKINLLGHSFGGATVRLFASIMEKGVAEEIAATPDEELSDFFRGGKGDWIYSITTLAAPHNGTTAYMVDKDDMPEDKIDFTGFTNDIQYALTNLIRAANGSNTDGRSEEDFASYDMYIDNALRMNKDILTLEDSYYFSFACSATEQQVDGTYHPKKGKVETLFLASSKAMGSYTGVTEGGYVIDESWQENDGLVNTVSALVPSDAPYKSYDAENVEKGIWNVMPVYDGDHMSLQGGLLKTNEVKYFYVEHLSMINSL